jgi:hypothetical protein
MLEGEEIFITPVSLENENRAWMRLHSEIVVALSRYQTSLAADLEQLKSETTLTYNKGNCIQLRVGEK